MAADEDTIALVALMRAGGRAWARYVVDLRRAGDARAVSAQDALERELGLLAYAAIAEATAELKRWRERGYQVVSMLNDRYPDNLRVVGNRPPLLFVAGALVAADRDSVAVIGTRQPTGPALRQAADVAMQLSAAGFVVFSGLAKGIDTSAHEAVLSRGGRTVAVLGTGLDHAYPPENADLQRLIADRGALVSQFWPDRGATKDSFPMRNALMAGMTMGSVIIEASPTSGTRIQARHVLAQGRKLVLMAPVLAQAWAAELVGQPGVSVAETTDDVLVAFGA